MDSSLKILVVEDHDDLREMTVEALCNLNYVVRGIACAELLDQTLQDFPVHLLILDLNLPGEDGISVSNRIRKTCPAMGIIIMTVREQIQDRVEGYVNGADIYMTKPTSIKELDVVIQSLSRRLTFQTKPENVFLQGSSSKEKIKNLHGYILGTKGKLPKLNEISKQFGISLKTLNDLFTDEYGQSISAFINDYRLSAAHEALEHSDTPMKQLAADLGYSHVNHFITAFKRKFGYSPGTLRKCIS